MFKRPLIIIGGGASVLNGIHLDLWSRIKNTPVWAINNTYQYMLHKPELILWQDYRFFTDNKDDILGLIPGVELVTRQDSNYDEYSKIKQYSINKRDITKHELFVGSLGLSGLMALDLAIKRGYKEIYLLGFDFGTNSLGNKNTHFYKQSDNSLQYLQRSNLPKCEVEDFKKFIGLANIYCVHPVNLNIFNNINYTSFFNRIEKPIKFRFDNIKNKIREKRNIEIRNKYIDKIVNKLNSKYKQFNFIRYDKSSTYFLANSCHIIEEKSKIAVFCYPKEIYKKYSQGAKKTVEINNNTIFIYAKYNTWHIWEEDNRLIKYNIESENLIQ